MKKIYTLISVFTLVFSALITHGQTTFNYTGAVQYYTVPPGVTNISVEAYGAQGGGVNGGLGGEAIAELTVTPGTVLEVYVGEKPLVQLGPGGFNGGGAVLMTPCAGGDGWPGGGASDVRVPPYGLTERIIVAGGGGGQGWSSGIGGAGGGTSGSDGAASWIAGTHGKGGTTSAGGAGGIYGSGPDSPAPSGSFGIGGNNSPLSTYCSGGAGGGGWYGGGGGYVSAGGGGSSYVSYPGTAAASTTAGVNSGNGYIVITELCIGLTTTVSADTICEGETVVLHAGSPGGGTVSWDGGITDSVAFTPSLGATTYTALSSISGECGFSVEIFVKVSPSVEAGADEDLCAGEVLNLSGTGTADSYTWNGGITNGVDFTPPVGTTVYTCSGLLTATGCIREDSLTVNVTEIDPTVITSGIILTSAQIGAAYQWVACPAYSPISGAIAQSYTPNGDGDYAVIITLNGCVDTSACETIAGVRINEMSSERFKLYPNPAENVVTIEFDGDFTYEVIDVLGAIILQGNGQNKEIIAISSFKSGTYIVRVSNGVFDETLRLTKL